MRIIFVRHGEPNYRLDCLTDLGHVQAAAAAKRLAGEGITQIFSSPCGRARETASYTAKEYGLPVTVLDYMREISWGGPDVPENGHPWKLSDIMIDSGFDFAENDWREHPYFRGNAAREYCEMISRRIDEWIGELGYRHDGLRFFCENPSDETVAMFSHGGSGACALSHLLGLPFPYVASVMPYGFTSITILSFAAEAGAWTHPRIELFNDCAHIHTDGGVRIQQVSSDKIR